MAMMKVRLKDDAHVMNVDKLLQGVKSFIGRKPKRATDATCDVCGFAVSADQPKCMRPIMGKECAGHAKIEFAPHGEVEEVSDHADHIMAVREGHLEIVTDKKVSKKE
jgi:hypothetical protein